jgi:hypothetical protein
MSVSGVKSSANRARAASIVACVQGWPMSAASTWRRAFRRARHAAEGDARVGDGAVLHRDVERAADGRDVLIEAFRQLVDAQPVGLTGKDTASTNSPGARSCLP